MLSYESPCGVMSLLRANIPSRAGLLRIPMQGYEQILMNDIYFCKKVTNPHAGL